MARVVTKKGSELRVGDRFEMGSKHAVPIEVLEIRPYPHMLQVRVRSVDGRPYLRDAIGGRMISDVTEGWIPVVTARSYKLVTG